MVAVLFHVGQGLEKPEVTCSLNLAWANANQAQTYPQVVKALLDVKANPGKPGYNMAYEQPLLLHDSCFDPAVMSMQYNTRKGALPWDARLVVVIAHALSCGAMQTTWLGSRAV